MTSLGNNVHLSGNLFAYVMFLEIYFESAWQAPDAPFISLQKLFIFNTEFIFAIYQNK